MRRVLSCASAYSAHANTVIIARVQRMRERCGNRVAGAMLQPALSASVVTLVFNIFATTRLFRACPPRRIRLHVRLLQISGTASPSRLQKRHNH